MNKKIFNLFIALLIALTSYVHVSADSLAELKERQRELERQREELNEQSRRAVDYFNDTTAEKSETLTEIASLDVALDEAEDALSVVNVNLYETNVLIENTESDLAQTQSLIEGQRQALKERIRYIQENGSVNYLDVLIDSKSVSDFLNRLEYINQIVLYDDSMIKNLQQSENKISDDLKLLENARSQAEILAQDALVKKQTLENTIAEKQTRLLELEKNENYYSTQITDFQNTDAALSALIAEAAEAAKNEEERLAREEAEKKARASLAEKYTGGIMQWPVSGYHTISSGYDYRVDPISGKTHSFHTGIDIPAPKGTDITAASSGKVILAEYYGGYGYAVVIDHGGGISTLYGHNSKLVVSVGDYVNAGQVISKCGSTGYSTGPHCHFEVRVNGTHTNPLAYVRK
ncbi:MAG: peptidoglycan DD-metalloendopeptidase family protein [Clostridiales bacterium]|jgi:murein DD-endopeptidase MepM/ murein hydrolase activator NlpD|nr:peptidoglycan DD-metalloendopeptidase family protein [Clostridiales bacterium]